MTGLPDPQQRPLLTIAELAAITGDGQKVLRSAVAAGQIPSIRVGRYLRIPTARLLREVFGIGPGGETPPPPRRLHALGSEGGPDAA
jgi:excisionase family DNA binding protein